VNTIIFYIIGIGIFLVFFGFYLREQGIFKMATVGNIGENAKFDSVISGGRSFFLCDEG